MKLKRAALLAIVPWVITMSLTLLYIHWNGIAGGGEWPNYLWRVGQVALILYVVFTWALIKSRPHSAKEAG
jgi:hypothetical protein